MVLAGLPAVLTGLLLIQSFLHTGYLGHKPQLRPSRISQPHLHSRCEHSIPSLQKLTSPGRQFLGGAHCATTQTV